MKTLLALLIGITATARAATLLYDNGVPYANTTGGFTLLYSEPAYDGVMTGQSFENSQAWNISAIVITADFTFGLAVTSTNLKIVSSSLTTEQSMTNLPFSIGPVIAVRGGTYEVREVTISTDGLVVPAGRHYLTLGFEGAGPGAYFAGWSGGNYTDPALPHGAIYSLSGDAPWIGEFSDSHAMFSIYADGVPVGGVPEPTRLLLLLASGCTLMMRRCRCTPSHLMKGCDVCSLQSPG